MAEAIFMAEDAASGWILTELEEGSKIPDATRLEDAKPEPGAFVNLVGTIGLVYIVL